MKPEGAVVRFGRRGRRWDRVERVERGAEIVRHREMKHERRIFARAALDGAGGFIPSSAYRFIF